MADKNQAGGKKPSDKVNAADKNKAQAQVATAKKVAKETYNVDESTRYRFKKRYLEEIVPALKKEQGYKNINEIPRLEKITVNMRLGDIKDNSKSIQIAIGELAAICGQKPVQTRAKKSVANFKVREGQVVGAKVTLRGNRMYEFLDKIISIALPRVRDFRGLSGKSFDGRGNYSFGFKEQIIFPEISYELIEKTRGFDICIVTTAKTDAEAKALLEKFGFPFKK